MNNTKNLPALISEKEAAELVGIKPRTWRRMSRSGVAPAPVKLGKGERPMIRFRRSELEAWIEAGCPMVKR
jgi:excisionase family DNA binding protein